MKDHIIWKNNKLVLLDQRKLPCREVYVVSKDYKMVLDAIKDMIVRGAPAIGITAAFGIAQAIWEKIKVERKTMTKKTLIAYFEKVCNEFAETRPTAVNLFWAIDRMKDTFYNSMDKHVYIVDILIKEAKKIQKEDILINKSIGFHGAKLFKKKMNVLTHCNAGALATAGYGTALGVIRAGYKAGKISRVFVDETRPYLQGSRLTAWELVNSRIPSILICDNMAGDLMVDKKVGAIIIGADRIVANGDTANKVGSYSLSVLAKHHKIPFYVAAPLSTIDLKTSTGKGIKIEERSADEVTHVEGKRIAPLGMKVFNPSFDVVPANLITAIITEKGIIKPKYRQNLKEIMKP